MLKTLAVDTVPSVAAILHEIESERDTCLVLQGMVFPECTDSERYWGIQGYPRIPHIRHLLSLIQHFRVETLVLNGVVMGADFQWLRTALRIFPRLKMLEAVVVIAEDSQGENARRCFEIGLLLENKDWTAIESVSQGVKPLCELGKALDNSWEFNVVADWPGKVREDSFQITLQKQQ
jgi:hypothetical protein